MPRKANLVPMGAGPDVMHRALLDANVKLAPLGKPDANGFVYSSAEAGLQTTMREKLEYHLRNAWPLLRMQIIPRKRS